MIPICYFRMVIYNFNDNRSCLKIFIADDFYLVRLFTLGVAILAPIFCYLCLLIGGVDLWNSIKYVSMLILLTGLIIATYIVGKKYE